MVENVSRVAEQCARWSLPLVAMLYPTDELLAERGKVVESLAAGAEARENGGAFPVADIQGVYYYGFLVDMSGSILSRFVHLD